MENKTAELTGALLDAAVALIEGLHIDGLRDGQCIVGVTPDRYVYSPSSKWAQGGPIIERERITVTLDDSRGEAWIATIDAWMCYDLEVTNPMLVGPTPMIAAMRAFVASKLGDEVELPS